MIDLPDFHDAVMLDVGAPASSPFLRRRTGTDSPIEVVWVCIQGQEELYVPAADLELVRASAPAARVHHIARLPGYSGSFIPSLVTLLASQAGPVHVPASFPARLYEYLQDQGIPVRTREFAFRRDLLVKGPGDRERVRGACDRVVAAVNLARDALALSRSRDTLRIGGAPLTSTVLRRLIASALGERDLGVQSITIGGGAVGYHGNPTSEHELRPGEAIVVDVVARDLTSGYVVDVARTWSIGPPHPEIERLHAAVLETKQAVEANIRAGVSVARIHEMTLTLLGRAGVVDGVRPLTWELPAVPVLHHSVGHGIGLELHEPPAAAADADVPLVVGMLFAFEPAAYVAGLGGVRIEDVLEISATGSTSLTAGIPADLVL